MRSANILFKKAKNARTGKLIYLYTITYDEDANLSLYWTNYGKAINFEDRTFEPYIITHDTMREDLTGAASGTSVRIANINRYIQAIHDNYDLVGKQVRIVTIVEEELTNPDSFIEDTFRVVDLTSNQNEIALRLSSPFDVMDLRIPRRYFFRGYCRFKFKGIECQYAGAEGECNKTLQRCQALQNTIHFGAFPSVPDQRLMLR